MTTAKPLARYSAIGGALASGLAPASYTTSGDATFLSDQTVGQTNAMTLIELRVCTRRKVQQYMLPTKISSIRAAESLQLKGETV